MLETGTDRKTQIDLEVILKPVEREFEWFQKSYEESLRSDVKLLDTIILYIVGQKGKRIRPLTVLLVSGLFGQINENSVKSAVVVEILHNATLVHDDIVDEAQFRRGKPTINDIWKSKISVLVGDYLLSKALIGASELGNLEIVNNLSDATRRMSQGEILQINASQKLDINEKQYFELISDKTAALFASCSLIAAIISGATQEEKGLMAQFGENLGIAFQIKDDLLDMLGKEKLIGKPKLADIANNRLTLPLIHALRSASAPESANILDLLKNTVHEREIDDILRFTDINGGFAYAYERCDEFALRAREILLLFPDSEYRMALNTLIDYVVRRAQ